MVSWSKDECRAFQVLMGALWQNWERQSSQVKELYIRSLEAWPPRVIKEALEAIKRDQDVERLPAIKRILEVAHEKGREFDARRRAAGASDGGVYRTPQEARIARLAAAGAFTLDSNGKRWRILEQGLDCRETNTLIPWTALPEAQVGRLLAEAEIRCEEESPFLSPEEFAADEEYWGPRVSDPDPHKAAWWRRQRVRLAGGRLPDFAEVVHEGRRPEESDGVDGEGPEEAGPLPSAEECPF